ncbi:MAG: nucleoside hydrolase-like domain-containing protein, partial [Planctomycetaceae bacterium]
GPLGAEYPPVAFMMEGDTPSFLNLIATGLTDPEHPDWGGWGGGMSWPARRCGSGIWSGRRAPYGPTPWTR